MKVLVKQRRRHPQCNQKTRPWQKPTMDAGPDFHPCTRHIHNFEIGWYARSSHFPTHPCREKAAVARSPKQVEHLGVSFEARYRFKKGRLWRGAPNKTTNWLGSPPLQALLTFRASGFLGIRCFFSWPVKRRLGCAELFQDFQHRRANGPSKLEASLGFPVKPQKKGAKGPPQQRHPLPHGLGV